MSNQIDDISDVQGQMWTEKYKPRKLEDLVGNKDIVQSFKEWLVNWEENPLDLRAPEPIQRPGQKKKKSQWTQNKAVNKTAKACLISGSPGIGKTSMVSIVAKSLGLDTMFINASDKRSKKVIENMLKDLTESSTMDHHF